MDEAKVRYLMYELRISSKFPFCSMISQTFITTEVIRNRLWHEVNNYTQFPSFLSILIGVASLLAILSTLRWNAASMQLWAETRLHTMSRNLTPLTLAGRDDISASHVPISSSERTESAIIHKFGRNCQT